MTERLMMYSCIIHDEVKYKGMSLLRISQLLSISYKQAQKLLNAYHPSFEEYNAMSLMRIISSKEKAQKTMEQIKSKVAQRYIAPIYSDKAFHMPITEEQEKEYNAIRKLVLADEYLPKSYRKPAEPEPIVRNKARYVFVPKEDDTVPNKKCNRIMWTQEMEDYLAQRYATTSISQVAQHLGVSNYSVERKARRMGIKKDKKYVSEARAENRRKKD